jgi:hypothetical protein
MAYNNKSCENLERFTFKNCEKYDKVLPLQDKISMRINLITHELSLSQNIITLLFIKNKLKDLRHEVKIISIRNKK